VNFVLDWDQPRCETCRWWMCDGSPYGECFRYPPASGGQFRPNVHGHGLDWTIGLCPQTEPNHFCGEHSPIPETLKAVNADSN
jgi:hypothetical protein